MHNQRVIEKRKYSRLVSERIQTLQWYYHPKLITSGNSFNRHRQLCLRLRSRAIAGALPVPRCRVLPRRGLLRLRVRARSLGLQYETNLKFDSSLETQLSPLSVTDRGEVRRDRAEVLREPR